MVTTDGPRLGLVTPLGNERNGIDTFVSDVLQHPCAEDRWYCVFDLEMDAGFSHPPIKIAEFVAAMEEGYDFAGGSRFMPGGAHRSPWTCSYLMDCDR